MLTWYSSNAVPLHETRATNKHESTYFGTSARVVVVTREQTTRIQTARLPKEGSLCPAGHPLSPHYGANGGAPNVNKLAGRRLLHAEMTNQRFCALYNRRSVSARTQTSAET